MWRKHLFHLKTWVYLMEFVQIEPRYQWCYFWWWSYQWSWNHSNRMLYAIQKFVSSTGTQWAWKESDVVLFVSIRLAAHIRLFKRFFVRFCVQSFSSIFAKQNRRHKIWTKNRSKIVTWARSLNKHNFNSSKIHTNIIKANITLFVYLFVTLSSLYHWTDFDEIWYRDS